MRNLHFPKELDIRNAFPQAKPSLKKWKELPYKEPLLSQKEFQLSGFGPEIELTSGWQHRKSGLDAGFHSPTGLLYRTVLNAKFVRSVLLSSFNITLSLQAGLETKPELLSYSSTFSHRRDSVTSYTPTTLRLIDAMEFYGASWGKHSEAGFDVEYYLNSFGVAVNSKRLLLLAIDSGSNRMLHGIDKGRFRKEVVLEGKIPLENVFILNDSPELLSRIIQLETAYWGTTPLLGPKPLPLDKEFYLME
jgi:hypothetical protein